MILVASLWALVAAHTSTVVRDSPYTWTLQMHPDTHTSHLAHAARTADTLGYRLYIDPQHARIGLGHDRHVYGMDCITSRFAATRPSASLQERVDAFISEWQPDACRADIWDAAHAPITLAAAVLCYGPCLYWAIALLWKNSDAV